MSSPDPDHTVSRPDVQRLEQLFHEASQIPDGEVAEFVARHCQGDDALRQKVMSLLGAAREAGTSWDRGAMAMEARHSAAHIDPARPGEFFGPYRIIRRIAAGGMGSVYEAVRDDPEFQMGVAIKFVQQGLDDPAAGERFRSERQILAQLEHPNIARLIDGGTTAEGTPYLVMEYVDGERIDAFVASKNLTRSERLELFRDVCDAVQHAHRHLVVHRDLKPGNILVTSEGSPKLLDFGIAKLLNAESHTLTVQALTPEYASPEQLRGGRITTASDIYSLGVLLFVLLTGRTPYRATAGQTVDLVRAISEEDPVWEPPGLIHGDLRSILARALAKEPEHRYASVEQFAEDVQRYVRGYPVVARAPSRWYRAARFCARNKGFVATAAALVMAIAAGFAVSAWQAWRASQQAELANRRLADARRLIYSVIHDIQPKLARIDGTVAVRAAMVDQTMGYLEAMSKDAADNPALLRELVDGYLELARLTGGGGSANVGSAEKAGQILKKAEALLDTLLRLEPSNRASMQLANSLYSAAARHELQYGLQETAHVYARRALETAERLSTASGADRASQEPVARAATALADVLTGDPDQKIALYERSASIWDRLLAEHPADSTALRTNLALMYRNLSNLWVVKRDFQRAIDLAAKARDLDEERVRADPTSPAARLNLAFDLGALAYAYDGNKDYRRAVEVQRANVAIREAIVKANPDDFRAGERLAFALQFLAREETATHEDDRALRDFRRALELYASLRRRGTLVQSSMVTYARTIVAMVHLQAKRGAGADRCVWLKTMQEVLEEYKDQAPLSPDAIEELEPMRVEARRCVPG
jgi:non-specific serine/threonine protein kinase/serine/threonine-protein kinase